MIVGRIALAQRERAFRGVARVLVAFGVVVLGDEREQDVGAQQRALGVAALVRRRRRIGHRQRAFARCDRAELVRRVLATPLPASRLRRWLLAGGGGIGWPIVIASVAFFTIITAVLKRGQSTSLVLALAAFTVVTCWMVITFSFALQYARRDIEQGGLRFAGSSEPVFTDYNYLAIGCSATFGVTDTTVLSSSMRRVVSVHSVLGLLMNTVVVAVLLSIIVS